MGLDAVRGGGSLGGFAASIRTRRRRRRARAPRAVVVGPPAPATDSSSRRSSEDARRARPRSGALISEQLACTMRAMATDWSPASLPQVWFWVRPSRLAATAATARLPHRRPDRDDVDATSGHAPATSSVAVYFLRDGKVSPGATERRRHARRRAGRRSTELLDGPTSEEAANGLATAIPAETRLRDVSSPTASRRSTSTGRSTTGRQRIDARARRAGRRDAHPVPHGRAGRVPDRRQAGRRDRRRGRRGRSADRSACHRGADPADPRRVAASRGHGDEARSACAARRTCSRPPSRSTCATRRKLLIADVHDGDVGDRDPRDVRHELALPDR